MEGPRAENATAEEISCQEEENTSSQETTNVCENNFEGERCLATVSIEDEFVVTGGNVTFVEKEAPRLAVQTLQTVSQSSPHTGEVKCPSANELEEELVVIHPRRELGSESGDYECRICRCVGEETLLSPCKCSGSAQWVHESCLVRWLKLSHTSKCEVCFQEIIVKKQTKPLKEWKRPRGGLGPCGRMDLWYAFICLFSISTIIAFSIFQATVKSKEPETTIVFSAIYVLCSILILMRVKYFYQWFTRRSTFWEKWLVLNQMWTIKSADQLPQEVII